MNKIITTLRPQMMFFVSNIVFYSIIYDISGHEEAIIKTFKTKIGFYQIKGGVPSLPCKRSGLAPVAYGCMKGTAVPLAKYQEKTKMGNFCFSPKGLGDQVKLKIYHLVYSMCPTQSHVIVSVTI